MMENWRQALEEARVGESKYKILVQAIVADIEGGTLVDGARLPTQREVSRRLGISVQTVTNAYKELEQHGLIRCEVGRGSFVSKPMTEKVATYMLDRAERSLIDFSIARMVHTTEHDQAWKQTCAQLASQDDQPWMREGFDRLLLDPPRSGADFVLTQLPLKQFKRIVFVSCHPASLARDAGYLVNEKGWRLVAAGVMDMFPHTAHVESIAMFEPR